MSPYLRSVKRESSNVKGFGGRAVGSPAFHRSRLTFHGSRERSENAAWERARPWVKRLSWQTQGGWCRSRRGWTA